LITTLQTASIGQGVTAKRWLVAVVLKKGWYSIAKQPATRYSCSGRRASPTSGLARGFGRGAAIGVGLFFLPFVFFPELVSAMLNVRSRQEPETKLKCAI
jgi:hypothetical protein